MSKNDSFYAMSSEFKIIIILSSLPLSIMFLCDWDTVQVMYSSSSCKHPVAHRGGDGTVHSLMKRELKAPRSALEPQEPRRAHRQKPL